MIIQECRHQTLSASGIGEALSLLRTPQPIDALFADVYLKKVVSGGIALAHQAIKLRPKLRVLYTTGDSVTYKLKTLFVEGALFLRQPYTLDQLQGSIGELLAARF
jgi:hypothetical protein